MKKPIFNFFLTACFVSSLPCEAAPQASTPETRAREVQAVELDLRAATDDYNKGDYAKALELCRFVVGKEPLNLEAHYLLGNIFSHVGRLDVAADEYDYCIRAGGKTQIASYARAALAQIVRGGPPEAQNAVAQPAPTAQPEKPPTKIDFQAAELKSMTEEKAQAALDNKRATLNGTVQKLTKLQQEEIEAVPQYLMMGKQRLANPDYSRIVQQIKDTYTTQIEALQADYANEEKKITAFYKNLSDSYDHAKTNLQSQTDDGRPGHKLIDQDPDLYVQNFAPRNKNSQPEQSKAPAVH